MRFIRSGQRIIAAVILAMAATAVFAQTFPDSVRINTLLAKSREFILLPGNKENDLKSALTLAEQASRLSRHMNNLRGEGKSYLVMAEAYREMNDLKKGREVSQRALSILSRYGNGIEKAKAHIEFGGTFGDDELEKKIYYYQKGADIFKRQGDRQSQAEILEFIANLYIEHDDFKKSLDELNAALLIYNQVGFKRLQGIYSLYGVAYNELGDLSESLKYNLLAAQTGERMKDSGPLMSTIYNRIGITYVSSAYYEQACEYFQKGLDIAIPASDSSAIQILQKNMADALRRDGRYAESLALMTKTDRDYPFKGPEPKRHSWFIFMKLYLALHQYKQAQVYYNKLLTFYHSDQITTRDQIAIEVLFAEYLQTIGKYDQAKVYLAAAEKRRATSFFTSEKEIKYEWLAYRSDSAAGNQRGAIAHYKKFKQISDQAFNTDKTRQLDQLRLQYETDKKDQDIQLLTQKALLQDASLRQEKTYRNVFIAGVVVLLAFSVMLYNRYRLKTRTNIKLERKRREIDERNLTLKKLLEEKEWLLKEIHHRVKNNLQIVISLLNSQSEYLQNKDAIMAIRSSQHRMYAMSLIHQRLYQADNLGLINMKAYVQELISYMKESFDLQKNVTLSVVCEDISLDVAQAVPVGLILNEAVSNAIKYAFTDERKGLISVIFKKDQDDRCRLVVQDNGAGLRQGTNILENGSLGMSLMQGLTDQLEGAFDVQTNAGVCITVDFKYKEVISAIAENEKK